MNKRKQIRSKKRNASTIVWLVFIGAGLILISAAFMVSNFDKSGSSSLSTTSDQYSTIPYEVNYPSPSLTLSDLSSNEVSLNQFLGVIVLVNNWATWCPPCKAEMPTLQAYYQKYKDDGFLIIAIESGESLEEVREFVSNYGISFPVWIDRKGEALNAFKNRNLPSSYVIDRTGDVRLTWTGEISFEMLEKYVTPLIKH